MRALSNEIAKNLVLAGVGSLTVQDSAVVVDDDLGAQFLVSEQDLGKNVGAEASIFHKVLMLTSCSEQRQQHPKYESSIPGSSLELILKVFSSKLPTFMHHLIW